MSPRQAPEWQVAQWLGEAPAGGLAGLRGRPVLAIAFQMLCPGCASSALPQILRAQAAFSEADLAVIGLHTVFEHHEVQGTPQALRAFLHEYRIGFPVAIDAPGDGGVPLTMRAYAMRGTPTVMLIDREGGLRMQTFGHIDDLRLGAAIASTIGERSRSSGPGENGLPPERPMGACPL